MSYEFSVIVLPQLPRKWKLVLNSKSSQTGEQDDKLSLADGIMSSDNVSSLADKVRGNKQSYETHRSMALTNIITYIFRNLRCR